MKKSFLFPQRANETAFSLFLLGLRLFMGIMLSTHGIQKLANLAALSTTFADPLGIGSQYSVLLAIFAELFCSILFIFGFLYRLSMIPMIVTMGIAFFKIHSGQMNGGELALIYFVIFILMYLTGPGKYAIDYLFVKGRSRKRR